MTDANEDVLRVPTKPQNRRHFVMLWLAAMAAIAYLCRTSISVVEKSIRADLGLSESAMGMILGPAFFWTYALAQIPAGYAGGRVGARISLPCFACLWSLATAVFGIFHWFPLLMLNWMLVGLAQAGAIPVAAKTIADWHPKAERAFASGTFVAAMSFGAAGGAALTGWLVSWMNWKSVFILYAIPGIVWAIGFAWWFRNRPEEHPRITSEELDLIRERTSTPTIVISASALSATKESKMPAALEESERTPWLLLVTSPAVWLICGQQYCRAAGLVFFASWFATFLQESRQITVTKSGMLSVLPHLATAMACLIGGRVADEVFRRTNNLVWSRKGLAVVSLILSTVFLFAAYFVNDATLAVTVISLGVFCAGLAGPSAYAVTMDLGGKHVASLFATMNMIGNLGAGMLPLMVPLLRRVIASNSTLLGLFGGDSWNAVILFIALLHLVAALCWYRLRMTGTVFEQSWLAKGSASA
ncbi:MFS transporter [Schlesneria paludicola]|uniref:MFS transporter n=1 Tax=Schlesneria paludicola TaxID=360056 RepID=UPI0012FC6788|nr:MFS transporter [Schlesneria paludicola]